MRKEEFRLFFKIMLKYLQVIKSLLYLTCQIKTYSHGKQGEN
jgi:hypothetical protein